MEDWSFAPRGRTKEMRCARFWPRLAEMWQLRILGTTGLTKMRFMPSKDGVLQFWFGPSGVQQLPIPGSGPPTNSCISCESGFKPAERNDEVGRKAHRGFKPSAGGNQ